MSVIDDSPVTVLGVTVRFALSVIPLYVADMVTVRFEETEEVEMLNGVEVDPPAATVTDGGRLTLASLAESRITAPPEGAGPLSTTLFEVVDSPPVTEDGDSVTVEIPTGVAARVIPVTAADSADIFPAAS